jgi:hypothetical protein
MVLTNQRPYNWDNLNKHSEPLTANRRPRGVTVFDIGRASGSKTSKANSVNKHHQAYLAKNKNMMPGALAGLHSDENYC